MPVTMSLNVSRSPTHSPTSIIYGQQMSYRGPDGAMRDFIAKKTADQIRQGNLEHMAKIATVKPVIDDDVEDEATGEARKGMAAASAARRAAEEEARKAEVKEYYARLKAKTTVIDDEMDTEAAAIARAEFAAASRARRAAEAAEIRRENEELKQRLSRRSTWTSPTRWRARRVKSVRPKTWRGAKPRLKSSRRRIWRCGGGSRSPRRRLTTT